ncbi:MAG: DUF493 domain-containing protein [Pseudomonadales bacterium]|nr:DUF493 domain-containing protein [Pseudomonadales bacterium]
MATPRTEKPKIEFPCDYPIKVVGVASTALHETVIKVMTRHVEGFSHTAVQVVDSSKGNYQSLRLTITATGEQQLKTIFRELMESGHVKMVL